MKKKDEDQIDKNIYLPDNVLSICNGFHACQELQEHHPKTIYIALISQLMSQEVLWIQIYLQKTHQKTHSLSIARKYNLKLYKSYAYIISIFVSYWSPFQYS